MVKEDKAIEDKVEESYFKNKFLRWLFNSKENMPEAIYLVNTLIFTMVLLILNFTVSFETTIVDDLLGFSLDSYNFMEAIMVFALYLITLLISIVESELFRIFIEDK